MQPTSSIPVEPSRATEEFSAGSSGNSASGWRKVLSTVGILIAAPAVALLLTTFVFQSYEVDGPSMETTLQNQDRLIVWKIPRTLARLSNRPNIPVRGEIVVFVKRDLYEPGDEQARQLIKRVVGLPGDRVVVKDGSITIYNKQNPNGYDPDLNHEYSQNIAPITNGEVDLVVPAGEVFVNGDNRTNSLDSRSFGTIKADDIIGTLVIRIFPVNKFDSFI